MAEPGIRSRARSVGRPRALLHEVGVGPEARGLEVDAAADREAVRAFLRRREESAFLELYDRHTPALYQFALRLLAGADQDAEDAVQETWLRAVDRIDRFRWDSSLRTWLMGFTLNCAREILRRPHRAPSGRPAAERMPRLPVHSPQDERIAAIMDLERALARLPDGLRIALILHDVEGHTHEEVAALLDISPGTSKSRTSRARRHLRALLRPDATAAGPREPSIEESK